MPGRNAHAGVRILERLVLEPAGKETEGAAELQQPLPVGAHKMDHRLLIDLVPMKPNAAAQGEFHPLAAASEFPVRKRF